MEGQSVRLSGLHEVHVCAVASDSREESVKRRKLIARAIVEFNRRSLFSDEKQAF